jgi:proteasome lid subunit RPN8/RPN11/predicted  nucleic acid-binding Zn-ribbon protein
MHAEVCGVLVGTLCWDGGPYLLIDGRIEGKHASHQSGSVTFTSETWDYIHEELAAKYPDKRIVGWYHTHPGFGIFLSNMDAFIHENFFSFPWEPAYVFDPQAETEGFFFRIGKDLVREEVCVCADVAPSVKEPPAEFANAGKIVIKDTVRRHYLLPMSAAVIAVVCLGCFALFSMNKVRSTEEAVRASETKVEALRGVLANKDAEIRRRQHEAEEWGVREETYEKEIAGLRFKVTTIATERKDLETSNKEKQTAVDRLKSERAELEQVIREREAQIFDRKNEVEQVKAELASAREQIQRLERRIKDIEDASESAKNHDELPLYENSPSLPLQKEKEVERDKPWYSWLIFWK